MIRKYLSHLELLCQFWIVLDHFGVVASPVITLLSILLHWIRTSKELQSSSLNFLSEQEQVFNAQNPKAVLAEPVSCFDAFFDTRVLFIDTIFFKLLMSV
jgi:hypothetical protein